MNLIIIEAIKQTGVANNGAFTAADMHDINAYIQQHHEADWLKHHGDDEDGEETGVLCLLMPLRLAGD